MNLTASIAPDGHSTIYDDFGASDKACLVRREEQRRVGGVAAVAHETDGDALKPRFEKRFNVTARALLRKPRLTIGVCNCPGTTVLTRMPLRRIARQRRATTG